VHEEDKLHLVQEADGLKTHALAEGFTLEELRQACNGDILAFLKDRQNSNKPGSAKPVNRQSPSGPHAVTVFSPNGLLKTAIRLFPELLHVRVTRRKDNPDSGSIARADFVSSTPEPSGSLISATAMSNPALAVPGWALPSRMHEERGSNPESPT
jgi:hypothetical protein